MSINLMNVFILIIWHWAANYKCLKIYCTALGILNINFINLINIHLINIFPSWVLLNIFECMWFKDQILFYKVGSLDKGTRPKNGNITGPIAPLECHTTLWIPAVPLKKWILIHLVELRKSVISFYGFGYFFQIICESASLPCDLDIFSWSSATPF